MIEISLFSVRKLVGELPTERRDLRKTIAPVSQYPRCHWKFWHVRVSRHCYVIHSPGGDLLPVCYRYDSGKNVFHSGICRSHFKTSALSFFDRYHGRLQQIWWSPWRSKVYPSGNYLGYYYHLACLYPHFDQGMKCWSKKGRFSS